MSGKRRRSETQVGIGELYMRKAEKVRDAGRNQRAVRAGSGEAVESACRNWRAVYAANGDRETEAGGK